MMSLMVFSDNLRNLDPSKISLKEASAWDYLRCKSHVGKNGCRTPYLNGPIELSRSIEEALFNNFKLILSMELQFNFLRFSGKTKRKPANHPLLF